MQRMSTNPTDRIAERRRFIAQRTAELKAQLDSLMAEGNELDIAERVYQRFSTPPAVGGQLERSPTAPTVNGAEEPEHHDAPTLPQMVHTILEEAKAAGRKGVDSKEILTVIQTRWKPEFTPENVRPTLWRLVKGGRLRKRGKIYSLPINPSEGIPEAVGASGVH